LIGSGASRRSVLKGLTGALIGAAGIVSRHQYGSATIVCTSVGDPCGGETNAPCCAGLVCLASSETCEACLPSGLGGCGSNEECCTGDCWKGLCFDCISSEDCGACEFCGGYVCVADCTVGEGNSCCNDGEICNLETGACEIEEPVCVGEGESCGFPNGEGEVPCCDGLACNDEGVCEEIVAPECETDEDCVLQAAGDVEAAICCGGVCITDIECCINDEDPNARCAEGSTCFEGVCVFACKGDSDCAEGTCCCSDGTCSSECCEDVDNTPPADTGGVTTLPNTGIGDGEGNLTGLLGAGLVAGGAAYLAGKKVKGSEQA